MTRSLLESLRGWKTEAVPSVNREGPVSPRPASSDYKRLYDWVMQLQLHRDGPGEVVKALQGLASTNHAVHACGARKRAKLKMYVKQAVEQGLTPPDVVLE